MQTGCGPLYVTVNEDSTGLFELFTTMGKAGGCAASQNEAIGRMVSLAWRSGLQARQVIKQLQGIPATPHSGFAKTRSLSCADAVAKAIQSHMTANGDKVQHEKRAFFKGACPTAAASSNTREAASSAASAATANALGKKRRS
jgi:ribonucleoside-diphosphate reductase alpha chain